MLRGGILRAFGPDVIMSSNFSANQYEGAFNPQRLQNFEVPAPVKKLHPTTRYGRTKIISNNNGHVVDERKRSPSSPWGTFVGTWQTGRKPIQLMTRTKLQSNFSDIQYLKAVPPDEVVDMTSKLTVGESVDVKPSKGEVSPVVSPHQENHNEEQTIPPQPESGRSISGTASPGSRPPTVVSEINI